MGSPIGERKTRFLTVAFHIFLIGGGSAATAGVPSGRPEGCGCARLGEPNHLAGGPCYAPLSQAGLHIRALPSGMSRRSPEPSARLGPASSREEDIRHETHIPTEPPQAR